MNGGLAYDINEEINLFPTIQINLDKRKEINSGCQNKGKN